MCGSILNLQRPLSFMLLSTGSEPFVLPSGFLQKRSKIPSRVHACCDRSSEAASTALDARDWYSLSETAGDCGCSSAGRGAVAEIFEGRPGGTFGCVDGDSRAVVIVGVDSFGVACDTFCLLGAGVALGGRPGPRFSTGADSAITPVVFHASAFIASVVLSLLKRDAVRGM